MLNVKLVGIRECHDRSGCEGKEARHGVGEEMGGLVGIYGVGWRKRGLGYVNWENIEEEDEWN